MTSQIPQNVNIDKNAALFFVDFSVKVSLTICKHTHSFTKATHTSSSSLARFHYRVASRKFQFAFHSKRWLQRIRNVHSVRLAMSSIYASICLHLLFCLPSLPFIVIHTNTQTHCFTFSFPCQFHKYRVCLYSLLALKNARICVTLLVKDYPVFLIFCFWFSIHLPNDCLFSLSPSLHFPISPFSSFGSQFDLLSFKKVITAKSLR